MRAVFMFVVGAVVGFCLLFYYAEIFGLPFILAPVGAVIIGICSAYFERAVAVFAAAAGIGYIIVLLVWLTYANLFGISDHDGGKTMEMIFILAPAGGAMIGLIATAMLARWGTYRRA